MIGRIKVTEDQGSPASTPSILRGWVMYAIIAAVVIIGFFVVIGAVKPKSNGPTPTASHTGAPGELTAGMPAPDFTATSFDGGTVRLSALKGKVVLVNFFASWCIECRAEMPAIQQQYLEKRASGFEVVGVDTWDSGDGKDFYRQMGATFPAVFDPQEGQRPGAIAHAFGIDTPSLPISILIDRDGKIRQVFPGGIDASVIKQQLRQMGIG